VWNVVTKSENLVNEVLECIEVLTSEAREPPKEFRTRARSLPADLIAHGLQYLVALTAARSSKSLIEKGLKGNSCADVVKSIMEEKEFDEVKRSYGLYGGVLVYLLKRQGVIEEGVSSFRDLLEKLTDPAVEAKSAPIIEWLKRLAEAYITTTE